MGTILKTRMDRTGIINPEKYMRHLGAMYKKCAAAEWHR